MGRGQSDKLLENGHSGGWNACGECSVGVLFDQDGLGRRLAYSLLAEYLLTGGSGGVGSLVENAGRTAGNSKAPDNQSSAHTPAR